MTHLTARESEVLTRLIEGDTNDQIGRTLYITRHTVNTHLEHIFAKLRVHNRVGAVNAAYQAGFCRAEEAQTP